MKVKCLINIPENLPEGIPDDFDYGLELGKEYIVMGIVTYKSSQVPYFLVDENGRPSWFPHQLFDLIENTIPGNWFLKINGVTEYSDIYSILGFEELCQDETYFDQLQDRVSGAMGIYFRRKEELKMHSFEE